MTTGRQEWKETGEELGGAFKKLAKSLIRTGAEGAKAAEEWAEQDESAAQESKNSESTVFNDGSWRDTGKSLGRAFAGLGSSIMGSIERGAGKAEEWADEAKDAMDSTVEKAAGKAEEKADSLKKDAEEFAEGLRDAERESGKDNGSVCDAEVISEEIIE